MRKKIIIIISIIVITIIIVLGYLSKQQMLVKTGMLKQSMNNLEKRF